MSPKVKMQPVVQTRFQQALYAKPGYGSVWMVLACGHMKVQRSSIPVPRRARCYNCPKPEAYGQGD